RALGVGFRDETPQFVNDPDLARARANARHEKPRAELVALAPGGLREPERLVGRTARLGEMAEEAANDREKAERIQIDARRHLRVLPFEELDETTLGVLIASEREECAGDVGSRSDPVA